MDLQLSRGAGRLKASHATCLCSTQPAEPHMKRRPLALATRSSFFSGRQLGSGVSNGTCKLSAKQRAFHFEVGGQDEEMDDDRAFYDFANLEKQTKVVDEQRRRRYFESASDYKKRMQSQRFTSIRRARQDSWVQPYSEVFEDEASPFQDMFESGANSLFATNEYVDGGFSDPDGGNEFKDRQTYSNNGKSDTKGLSSGEVSQVEKFTPTEADDLKDGFRKPMSSRVRDDAEAVPKRAPGSTDNKAANRVDARAASSPVKTAARAQQQASQKSDASEIEVSSASQGNIGTRPDATSQVPASSNEPLTSNQFETPAPDNVPASKDTRKPKTPVKGFAGGRGSKPGKNPSTSKGGGGSQKSQPRKGK